ncbi:hypothetical protein ACI78T_14585 [Blastococcus sp. SYSU D00922]
MTDLARAAAALLVVVVLGACGAPREQAPVQTLEVPPAPTVPHEPGQTFEVPPPPRPVSWTDDGHLSVTAYGSSSCPAGPTRVRATGPQEIEVDIDLLFPDRDPCTADMSPTTTEVELPDGVSPDDELTVHLRYGEDRETIVLPPAGR